MAKQINKELKIGTLLRGGDYKITEVLGIGGFGITYKVVHVGLEKELAIKEFFLSGYSVRDVDDATITLQDLNVDAYDNFKVRFREEAKTLAALKHPNIVDVQDIFEENDTTYFVMPFLEGKTLKELVQAKAKSTEELLQIVSEIGDAVQYIHEQGILHRDIKPENIIVTPKGKAILIDFGSAREFIHDKTQTHTSVLTKGYAPIEQYSNSSKKGNYTDIYSLGGVLYFALTGQKPTDATARMVEELPSVQSLNPDVPKHIDEAITKALAMKPTDRYQVVKDFLNDISKANQVIASTTVEEPEIKDKTIIDQTEELEEEPIKEEFREINDESSKDEKPSKTVSEETSEKSIIDQSTTTYQKEHEDHKAESKVQSKPQKEEKKKPLGAIVAAVLVVIAIVVIVVIKPFGRSSEQEGRDKVEQIEESENPANKVEYAGLEYFSEMTDGRSNWSLSNGELISDNGIDVYGNDDYSPADDIRKNIVDFGIDFNRDFNLSFKIESGETSNSLNAPFQIGGNQEGGLSFGLNSFQSSSITSLSQSFDFYKEYDSEVSLFEIRIIRKSDTLEFYSNNELIKSSTNYSYNLPGSSVEFSLGSYMVPYRVKDFKLEGFLKTGLPSDFVPKALLTQADIVMIVEEEIATSTPQKEEKEESAPPIEESEVMVPFTLLIDECSTGDKADISVQVFNVWGEEVAPEMSNSQGRFVFEIEESSITNVLLFRVQKEGKSADWGLKEKDIDGSNLTLCITEDDSGVMIINDGEVEVANSTEEVLEKEPEEIEYVSLEYFFGESMISKGSMGPELNWIISKKSIEISRSYKGMGLVERNRVKKAARDRDELVIWNSLMLSAAEFRFEIDMSRSDLITKNTVYFIFEGDRTTRQSMHFDITDSGLYFEFYKGNEYQDLTDYINRKTNSSITLVVERKDNDFLCYVDQELLFKVNDFHKTKLSRIGLQAFGWETSKSGFLSKFENFKFIKKND